MLQRDERMEAGRGDARIPDSKMNYLIQKLTPLVTKFLTNFKHIEPNIMSFFVYLSVGQSKTILKVRLECSESLIPKK
jgi:hypothetical protein